VECSGAASPGRGAGGLSALATGAVILPFSLSQEWAADHLGMNSMPKAGYHPSDPEVSGCGCDPDLLLGGGGVASAATIGWGRGRAPDFPVRSCISP
jgi:hypothetical protein